MPKRSAAAFVTMLTWLMIMCAGCQSSSPTASPQQVATPDSVRRTLTADNNPTTLSGRGAPSLDDSATPPAWIYVDEKSGTYVEKDGTQLLQWVIDSPVSSTPTIRVEVFEPLLGAPDEVQIVLRGSGDDAPAVFYSTTSEKNYVKMGVPYSLWDSGSGFVIHDQFVPATTAKDKIVDEIPPLPPGNYIILASLKNSVTGAKGLAVSTFTVGDGG